MLFSSTKRSNIWIKAMDFYSKYSKKLPDHTKQSAADAIKTASKRLSQKTAKATGDLTGNNIADKITRVSKTLPQNNPVTNKE